MPILYSILRLNRLCIISVLLINTLLFNAYGAKQSSSKQLRTSATIKRQAIQAKRMKYRQEYKDIQRDLRSLDSQYHDYLMRRKNLQRKQNALKERVAIMYQSAIKRPTMFYSNKELAKINYDTMSYYDKHILCKMGQKERVKYLSCYKKLQVTTAKLAKLESLYAKEYNGLREKLIQQQRSLKSKLNPLSHRPVKIKNSNRVRFHQKITQAPVATIVQPSRRHHSLPQSSAKHGTHTSHAPTAAPQASFVAPPVQKQPLPVVTATEISQPSLLPPPTQLPSMQPTAPLAPPYSQPLSNPNPKQSSTPSVLNEPAQPLGLSVPEYEGN